MIERSRRGKLSTLSIPDVSGSAEIKGGEFGQVLVGNCQESRCRDPGRVFPNRKSLLPFWSSSIAYLLNPPFVYGKQLLPQYWYRHNLSSNTIDIRFPPRVCKPDRNMYRMRLSAADVKRKRPTTPNQL